MKGIKLLFVCLIAILCNSLDAQSVLPALKDNQSAQTIILKEVDNLEELIKNNPSQELSRKLDLFELAVQILNEPTQIKPTTEYALTSAFLNHEVKWNQLVDTEALMKYQRKQWSKEFLELLNLVKI